MCAYCLVEHGTEGLVCNWIDCGFLPFESAGSCFERGRF